MISLIVAVDADCGIGKNGQIPWHYTEDMKHFARTTKGSTCIMGRVTCEDIIAVHEHEKILPNRESIVITRNTNGKYRDGITASSLTEAISKATRDNVFIVGGANLYREAIKIVDEVIITYIPNTHGCDVKIPDVVRSIVDDFVLVDEHTTDTGLVFTRAIRK